MHGHFRGKDRIAGPDIVVPSKFATMDEHNPFLALDVLGNECVIECGTLADHRTGHIVDARAVAVLRSITGAVGAVSAVSSTREEEPRFAVAVSTPARVRAGAPIRALQQLARTVAVWTSVGFLPVPGEVLRIGVVGPSWSMFPHHRAAADGGRDVAIHHDDVVVIVVDVVAPDVICRYTFACTTSRFRQNPREVDRGTATTDNPAAASLRPRYGMLTTRLRRQ